MEMNNSTGQDGICPDCHAKVDWLVFAEDRTVTGEFRDGIHYDVDSWPIGEDTMTYECPKFRNEREASAFLGRQMQRRRGPRSRTTRRQAVSTSVKDQELVIE